MSQTTRPITTDAQWPPPAPMVAGAIYAAVLQGKVTQEEIDAVNGLPPSGFPDSLMIKLGFNPPIRQMQEPRPTPPSEAAPPL